MNDTRKSDVLNSRRASVNGSAQEVNWILVRYFMYPACLAISITDFAPLAVAALWVAWSINVLHAGKAPNAELNDRRNQPES